MATKKTITLVIIDYYLIYNIHPYTPFKLLSDQYQFYTRSLRENEFCSVTVIAPSRIHAYLTLMDQGYIIIDLV